jgi:heavy metal efflux system protein
MISRLLQFAITNRWLVLLLTVAAAGLGAYDFTRLPIDAVPDITNKQVQINTGVTGLSPVEIEKQITCPIEWAMQGIPGVEEVRSVSFYGVSQVTAIFKDDVDLYRARQLVSERLAEAKESLPAGVGTPFLGPIWTGLGEIYFWSVSATGPKPDGTPYTPMDLRTIQEWIVKPQLRSVAGLAEVNSIGGFEKQYHVRPDPMKLIAYGLSFRDVLGALTANNSNVGGGYIEHSGEQYTIRSAGQIRTMDDIRNIKLGTQDGVPFFIKDVAEVGLGSELRTGAGTANGKEAVLGTAILLSGENSRVVSRRVDDRLAEVRKSLPENVNIETLYDRTYLVDATLETVRKNLTEGAILVMIVLFLMLGNIRAAIICALAIPLAMLMTITGMVHSQISGNLMSLGAIDFGLIVDGAVIIVENCLRHIAEKQHLRGRTLTLPERLEAVFEASIQVRSATAFGEAIIVIVYIPILALSGVEGKMFEPMALTVIFALVAAFILSMTFVPAMVAILVRGRVQERENWAVRGCKGVYAPVLRTALRLRWGVLVGAVAVIALSSLVATRLGSEFAPKLTEGALALQPTRMPSIALTSSVEMQQRVEAALLKEFPDEIATIFARTGTSEVVTDVCGPEVSDTYIMLKPRQSWKKASTQAELAEAMQAAVSKLPGQNYEFSQPIELRMNELVSGVRSDLAIKVYGEDMEILLKYANQVAQELRRVRGAEDIKIEQVEGMPMLTVEIDRAAAARYGLNVSDIQEVIEIAMGGATAGHVMEGDRRYKLVVRLPENLRGNPKTLGDLPVPLPRVDSDAHTRLVAAGEAFAPGYVPLSNLAKITVSDGARQIRREDGRRRLVVQCNVRGRDLGGFVAEAQGRIRTKVGRLPEGYWLGWGGQFENMIAAQRRLAVVVPMALGLIGILLFATFRSIRQALLVFTGVPLALTGGIAALWMRGMPFSISAGVGFIALSGVAVLNGLVLVTFINQLRREGVSLHDAIARGAMTRLRPVLMTAAVAALGFVPMALATGTGSEVQKPLATVVIGGIMSSTLLTLIVLPALYALLEGAIANPRALREPVPALVE